MSPLAAALVTTAGCAVLRAQYHPPPQGPRIAGSADASESSGDSP
jgi:hypothetical protein